MIQLLLLDPGGFHVFRRVLPFGIVSEPFRQKTRRTWLRITMAISGFRLPAIHPVFQPDLHPEAAIASQRAALPTELLGNKLFKKFSTEAGL